MYAWHKTWGMEQNDSTVKEKKKWEMRRGLRTATAPACTTKRLLHALTNREHYLNLNLNKMSIHLSITASNSSIHGRFTLRQNCTDEFTHDTENNCIAPYVQ